MTSSRSVVSRLLSAGIVAALAAAWVVSATFLTREVHAVDYAMARIECPETTIVKLNWKNHIGSDPGFTVYQHYEKEYTVSFKKSDRPEQPPYRGQYLFCRYEMPNSNPKLEANYFYHVKRKIISCTGFPGRVIECKLAKK